MEVQDPSFAQIDNEVKFIDIDELKNNEMMLWNRRSIYKLPASVTDLNKNAYRPQVISFGPYHYNDPNLRPMEEHKRRILCHFLRRGRRTLQSYFDLLVKEEDDLIGTYYPQLSYGENKFLDIMVRDGCCMLEILQSSTESIVPLDYDSHDPIFGEHGRLHFLPYIKRDMLKLENQLPMRVLVTLYGQGVDAVNRLVCEFFFQKPGHALGQCEHVLDLYRKLLLREYHTEDQGPEATPSLPSPSPSPQPSRPSPSPSRPSLPTSPSPSLPPSPPSSSQPSPSPPPLPPRSRSLPLPPPPPRWSPPQPPRSRSLPPSSPRPRPRRGFKILALVTNPHILTEGQIVVADDLVIRPAKELYEAGIRIRKSTTGNLRDIKFDPNTGTLTVPRIVVDDVTEPLYLNLIAFERFHVKADNSVTAYAFFMDNIINDAKDISLLHKYDIVQNGFGSDEAAAHFFNSLSKEVALGKYGSLKEVNKDVNKYCKRWWPRWRSHFFRTYLRNPWILISVIAAIVLFFLTAIQTVYTVMSFYQSKDRKS